MRYRDTISKYREERRTERRELESGGFTRPFTTRFKGVALVASTVLVVIVFLVAVAMTDLPEGESRADVMSAGLAAIIGVGVLITGLQQWRAARDEITLDKFYERLESSNKLLDSWQEARVFVSLVPDGRGVEPERYYRRVMYVYRELDNLEYGLAKYRIGYMSAENAYRCLRTFRARCLSEDFRNLAKECVRCEPGYNKETIDVVNKAGEWACTHSREIVVDSSAAGERRHRRRKPGRCCARAPAPTRSVGGGRGPSATRAGQGVSTHTSRLMHSILGRAVPLLSGARTDEVRALRRCDVEPTLRPSTPRSEE